MIERSYKGEIVTDVTTLKEGDVVQVTAPKNYYIPQFVIINRVDKGWRPGSWSIYYCDGANGNWELKVFGYTNGLKDIVIKRLTGTKGENIRKPYSYYKTLSFPKFKSNVTVGTDPEIFAVDENGKVIPAWKYLGPKNKPNRLPYPYERSNAYWDGFQAEFDTPAGQTCLAYMTDDVQNGLSTVYTHMKKFNPKARLSNSSVLPVDPITLRESEDQHVQFGCMPSKNVYGIKGDTADGKITLYRFAGGHIHFGHEIRDEARIASGIRAMDAILGIATVSLFAEFDFPIRRRYYGLAGEYRTPKHGIEYRTLSNGWLMHPMLTHLTFDLARCAWEYGVGAFTSWKCKEDEAIKAIQECDVELARSILDRNREIFVAMMNVIYVGHGDLAYKVFFEGVEKHVETPSDIERNWSLKDYKEGWASHSGNRNACFTNAMGFIAKGKKV